MKIDIQSKREIIWFSLAGIIVVAIDFSVYYFLINFLPCSLSKGISFLCAGIIGYLFNKYCTFQYSQPSYAEVHRYTLINFIAFSINVLINQRILSVWPGAIFAALVIATAVTSLFTFVCFKWWVFRIQLNEKVSFMWWKWFPWKFLVRNAARRQGFLDPIKILSQLQNFAQPSEVAAPTELLRSGVVLHARGLMNSLAIQHNLDWVWPYWVECQYDPENIAFIPRSFSLTQINLTHRNWTALGVPGGNEYSLVDPRGLVTPFYDGWSIDVWMIPEQGAPLIPSRSPDVSQILGFDNNLYVKTELSLNQLKLQLETRVIGSAQALICQIKISANTLIKAQLVVSLRPYNPEGVSFINHIDLLNDSLGWHVNRENFVYFDNAPDQCIFSDYQQGDVCSRLSSMDKLKEIDCKVGMASAAALYALESGQSKEITLSIPLSKNVIKKETYRDDQEAAQLAWKESLQGVCVLKIPDEHFQSLYETAIYTMILHSPKEVYPGPYIYRRFWFRDAAFILHALLCVGLKDRVRLALDCFRFRQTAQGYFLSQEGEWDSNGEALWIIRQYCEMTNQVPPQEWKISILKGGKWIIKKLLSEKLTTAHAGLLPSGFSAEHLGPNDFYYWDDFWAVSGLNAASYLSSKYNENDAVIHFDRTSKDLAVSIDKSLKNVEHRLKKPLMPASPYRRMDTGAIGSVVAGYPLRIFSKNDPRLLNTVEFLLQNCLVHGGFFHDMTHSGINPYLTLHLAQVLLRAGDPRYFDLMSADARLATSTGQWPESVHPRTGGGCMGDGQHVWAAAEWVLMIRNCFVREEQDSLILCSGIPQQWLTKKQTMSFGPAPTSFGNIFISITPHEQDVLIEWQGQWFGKEPMIEIKMPGFKSTRVLPGTNSLELRLSG